MTDEKTSERHDEASGMVLRSADAERVKASLARLESNESHCTEEYNAVAGALLRIEHGPPRAIGSFRARGVGGRFAIWGTLSGTMPRLSPDEQLALWVAGSPVCPNTRNECCPDFSCCRPALLWPVEQRQAFERADQPERERMMIEGLAGLVRTAGEAAHRASGGDTRSPELREGLQEWAEGFEDWVASGGKD